jgi:uncharacterized cofD-like protein
MTKKAEPIVVALGGGTGLSTMLRGLKKHTKRLTAIVTMADDGGGSGRLRNELGMAPPGDIRNCLAALANTEPTMEQLLSYRFSEGGLAGQSLGNLFLAALNDIYGSFYGAVQSLGEVLAITGRVLPVTAEDVRLLAFLDNGSYVFGESKIKAALKSQPESRIKQVKLIPENPPALRESIEALGEAELIVLGPGSLYTSIIPNLLTDGISQAIRASNAVKVMVLNVATEDGETENYKASDHVKAFFDHGGGKLFELCLANSEPFPEAVLANHRSVGGGQTLIDLEELERLGVSVVQRPLIEYGDGFAHHDPALLAQELMKLHRDHSPTRVYGQK